MEPTKSVAGMEKHLMAMACGPDKAMQPYIGCKIIKAMPMSEHTFRQAVKGETISNSEPGDRPGYFILYPDGYKSWSPKHAFESAYRLISPEEKGIIA